jgi:hypothetical protein
LDRYLTTILRNGKKSFDKATGRRRFEWVSHEGVVFYIGTFIRGKEEVVNTIHTNRGPSETKKLGTHLKGKNSLSVNQATHTISNSALDVNLKLSSADLAYKQGLVDAPLDVGDPEIVKTDKNGTSRFSIATYEQGGRKVLVTQGSSQEVLPHP